MKKIFSLLLVLSIICSIIIIPTSVSAGGIVALASSNVEGEISVYVNGSKLLMDVPATIINNRTMVPLRAIFEALGAEVVWDKESQGIFSHKDGKLIYMQIGNNVMATAKMSDSTGESIETKEIDVAPVVKNDRTLVPVRAVSEALNCSVEWEQATKAVNIKSKEILESKTAGNKPMFGVSGADISNGIVYYVIGDRTSIYAYSNGMTTEYNVGVKVGELLASGDYIYYINPTAKTICSVNIETGVRKTLTKSLEGIISFLVCGNLMRISGKEDTYLDLNTGKTIDESIWDSVTEDASFYWDNGTFQIYGNGVNGQQVLPRQDDGWKYECSGGISKGEYELKRTNEAGISETLYTLHVSSYELDLSYMKILDLSYDKIVFGTFEYSWKPNTWEHHIYIMNTDGSEIEEVCTFIDISGIKNLYTGSGSSSGGYSSGGGYSSDGGGAYIEPAKSCVICGGRGTVTCYYCKGSGYVADLYVGALHSMGDTKPCTRCNGGQMTCSGCNGRGTL